MHLSGIGNGYVGTTIARCFAELGHEVVNVDLNEGIVDAINSGKVLTQENDLPELVATHANSDGAGRLSATTEYEAILDIDVMSPCLSTPQNPDGSIDLFIIEAATTQLGEALAPKAAWHTVIVKSTVISRTTGEVITPLLRSLTTCVGVSKLIDWFRSNRDGHEPLIVED